MPGDRKNFSEMTQEEKLAKFESWAKRQDTRGGQNKAKRSALAALKKAHLGEYNRLLKAAGGKVPEGEPVDTAPAKK